jgi:hypothetical protein
MNGINWPVLILLVCVVICAALNYVSFRRGESSQKGRPLTLKDLPRGKEFRLAHSTYDASLPVQLIVFTLPVSQETLYHYLILTPGPFEGRVLTSPMLLNRKFRIDEHGKVI